MSAPGLTARKWAVLRDRVLQAIKQAKTDPRRLSHRQRKILAEAAESWIEMLRPILG